MKKILIRITIAFSVIIFSFWVGRIIEHQSSGYKYTERFSKSFEFDHGKIDLVYATEALGGPTLLDPGTSIIFLKKDEIPIRLYTAPRVFQESHFHVSDIKIDGNKIEWEDGIYKYNLIIEKLLNNQTRKEQGSGGNFGNATEIYED